MRIVIAHQTVAVHDAVGNDIEQMYLLLKPKYECYVYAQNGLNNQIQYIDKSQLEMILSEKDSVLIYHHSVYWEEGQEILDKAKGQVVIRYHNVTPSEFFESYSQLHYAQCKKGREQTALFVERYPHAVWLCDSEYNEQDILGVPKERRYICPPFNKISEWESIIPEENTLRKLIESENIQILFVGRVAPNKGHIFLLDILRTFRSNYGDGIHLNVLGKMDESLAEYNDEIEEYLTRYRLREQVSFVGEMTDEKMAAYYLGCDFFVCVSEHEGFCVPILEAQYFGLPIIALDACAVPDTGGDGQILLEKDEKKFVAALRVLDTDKKGYEYVRNKGFENIQTRMAYATIKETFEEFCKKVLDVER